MKEGFWGNYETGIRFQIDEHEMWLRRGGNAEKLGVPDNIIARFPHFGDRETLLPFVYRNAPVMRWRCHGESVTFEFYAEDWQKPLELIRKWCMLFAGDHLFLRLVNFNGMETRETLWKNWNGTFRRRKKDSEKMKSQAASGGKFRDRPGSTVWCPCPRWRDFRIFFTESA